jgi:hypothetical protein
MRYRLEDEPRLLEKLAAIHEAQSHKEQHGDWGAGRIELALKLLHAGAERVADAADGLVVNDRLIVAVHSNRWRVDGRWKWYWYSNVADLLSRYSRR